MKTCTRCRRRQTDDQFSPDQKRCKRCRALLARERLKSKPLTAEQKQRNRENIKRKTEELWEWNNQIKAKTPCADCGQTKDPSRMDWDHLPGTSKVAAVSTLIWQGREQKVKEEIEKCELVCRSCHTKRSLKRKQIKFAGRPKVY